MSAASLASYLIGKLKSDEATTGGMSGRGRDSPATRLTTVWRTKSIPYDIPDTSSFRNEGSLLRLLRTKSMPLLGVEGSTSPRRPVITPQSSSPVRSESPSPVRRPTSRTLNSRKMSSGHLSDASVSTVPSVNTPPPTPRSPSPSRSRTRSASDGHLWQRRKKQMRRATDKAAITLPSVKNLRGKFDEKPAAPPGDEQLLAGPGQVDGDTLEEDSETGEGMERRQVSRHYSLVRREVKSPERRQPPKPAVTPANVRKLLEKFESSRQNEDEADDVFSRSDSQDLRSKCSSEVSLKTSASEVPQEDQIRRRTGHASRHRTKNHRRSKSEPDPSALLRHYAQTSPPSVKKLKIMFEREALAVSGNDLPMGVTPERTSPLQRQKDTTPDPPQGRAPREKPAEETATVDSSAADNLHPGVVEVTQSRQQAKTPPMIEADHALAAATPSVRSLRQRFEEVASAQSLLKTVEEEVAAKPRRTIVHQLKTPFEEPERHKSKSVSPEKEVRRSLTGFSSASVKNLLRQFEALSPEENQEATQDGPGDDPRLPPATDSHQQKLQTLPLDHATVKAQQDPESGGKVTLEVDPNWRQQSRKSSSGSSSGDEWREEEGRRRRKAMEQERKRNKEEKAKESERTEQEQELLQAKIDMIEVEKDKIELESRKIRKENEKESTEKERADQEGKAKKKEEEERRTREILEKENEAKEKLEKERKIREKAEQERLAKEEEEKRKERNFLEQKRKEKEKTELEIRKKEREEKERKEMEIEEDERKKRERVKHEKEMQEKAEEERREREKEEKEKAQDEENRMKREREEIERLHKEQLEEKRKREERSSKEEFIRRFSDEETLKGVGGEKSHENDENKPNDKSNDRKVHEMIDRFTHLGQRGDSLPSDASSPPQGEASAEQRAEQVINQFTNLRDADLEWETLKGDKDSEGRRYSDVAALVSKFGKLNERRRSSSSSDSEGSKSREKPVKEEAPIPTIPARSSGPGKVRTLREDEMRFFESPASGGGGTEPFMRTQSLRAKKSEVSHFAQPRFGSLRGSKSRVAVLSTSSTTTAALPKNCRRLNSDELQFFTGEVTNIYRNRTTKPRARAGKTGRGDGRPPKVPGDNALPDTEEFFRIAGRGNLGSEPNGRPAPSGDDSDSEPSVLRSSDDVITDSEGDIYELDINLRSDAETEDASDTENHSDLDQTLTLFVHTIQGELLQPVTTEGHEEAESRCYVVFSPKNDLCSSDDEDDAVQFPFPSLTIKENVPTPTLKENEISLALEVQEGALHGAPGEAVVFKASTGNRKAEGSDDKHTEKEDYTSQPLRSTYSSEKDVNSWQTTDSSQHDGLTTKENGAGIDFLGVTKVDFQPFESFKGLVVTERETGKTGETDSKEGGRHLLTHEEKGSNDEEKKREVEKEEEVNIKKVNLQEDWAEERAPEDSLLREEQNAIAAFLEVLDELNSLPPTTLPPTTTRRRENPYRRMNDDDSNSVISSEDGEGHPDLTAEDVRNIEEQIIPSASIQELVAFPEDPSSTLHSDDGPLSTAKDIRDTEAPSQDSTTPLRTTEDLFIAAPPSGTQESGLINSFNDVLKEEEDIWVEKEENHTSSLLYKHPERQEEEERTEIRGDCTVLGEEEAEENTTSQPSPPQEENEDMITGREFIKFCIFSLWFSILMYFFSDLID